MSLLDFFDILLPVVVLGSMLILLALGLEIAWSLAIAATIGLVFFLDQPINQLAYTSWSTLNSFTMSALPLFVLMGAVLSNSGASEYIFDGIEKWLGRLPGGLATSTIAGNAIFGAMCGSSVAATATFGRLVFPTMEERGYQPGFALACIGMGALLSPLIPPSALLIIYGAWQRVSIVALFAAAIVPGIMLALLLMLTVVIVASLNRNLAPQGDKYTWRERLVATRNLIPFALIIVLVLGFLLGGITTPTEAGAIGAFLSIVVSLAYRRLNMAVLRASLFDAVKVTSFALFIVAMASVIAHVFNLAGITSGAKELVLGLGLGKYGTLVLFFVGYLIGGMFLEAWSMLFITMPLVMPILHELNISPVWWGVAYVIAGENSIMTPPFGLALFVLQGIAPQHPVETIFRAALPLFIPVYLTLALMVIFPETALWLPSLIGL